MCLIVFSLNAHPAYRLIAAANRDEFYDRPSAPLDFWDEAPDVLAGRDLLSGGTWIGVSRGGRFGAVTNFREPGAHLIDAPSRGLLVSNFLASDASANVYISHIASVGARYNGFNLVVGDAEDFFYYSNRQEKVKRLDAGVYGLSNRFLDTPWPKTEKVKAGLAAMLSEPRPDPEALFLLLEDRTLPPDHMLPDTGVPREWERTLSPVFIESPGYGTRSSSLVFIETSGTLTFLERAVGPGAPEDRTRRFSFAVDNPA